MTTRRLVLLPLVATFPGTWWDFWTSGQVTNIVPKVFPDPPTSYLEIEIVKSSKTFIAPEDGWFKFIGVAASGRGASGNNYSGRDYVTGGSGGSGGIVVSIFALTQGESVELVCSGNTSITSKEEIATATAGGNGTAGILGSHGWGGTPGKGGSAGGASGGNLENIPGTKGPDGAMNVNSVPSVSNSYEKYSTTGGYGQVNNYNDGTAAYIVILRGNTNLELSQQNALDITALSLEMIRIAQEQTEFLLQK